MHAVSTWGYSRGMPKVSVYLPDALSHEAQARQIPLSALTPQAYQSLSGRYPPSS